MFCAVPSKPTSVTLRSRSVSLKKLMLKFWVRVFKGEAWFKQATWSFDNSYCFLKRRYNKQNKYVWFQAYIQYLLTVPGARCHHFLSLVYFHIIFGVNSLHKVNLINCYCVTSFNKTQIVVDIVLVKTITAPFFLLR